VIEVKFKKKKKKGEREREKKRRRRMYKKWTGRREGSHWTFGPQTLSRAVLS
jgi:hypothetical protein